MQCRNGNISFFCSETVNPGVSIVKRERTMTERNRTNRNRESEILWVVLVSILTAGWIVLCPMIMRWYVNTGRMFDEKGILERHPAAVVQAYIKDRFPLWFYELRHTVTDVCDTLRDLPYLLSGEDRNTVVYEYTYLPEAEEGSHS